MTGKVMVVSCDPGLTGLLNSTLPARGYRVINTHFSEDIASDVKAAKPSVVIVDMAKTIRHDAPFYSDLQRSVEVPVVMVSTRIIAKDQIRMIDCSDECITDEPIRNTEFIHRIEDMASDGTSCRY
jgi:DNA-binding response OmpR family regulator